MKIIAGFILVAIFAAGCSDSKNVKTNSTAETGMGNGKIKVDSTTIYQFTAEGLTGERINFSEFKGKKILVVNTASECGYTPQYKDLEALYQKYKGQLVVVGFPANNFGGQEPGTNLEIKTFCEKNYGVSFPLAAKTSVTGADQNIIYQWLTSKEKNGVLDAKVSWNFNKFLLDENGHLLAYFPSKVSPLSPEITDKL